MHQIPERFRDLTLADFIDRLASPDPVPGGGSAAAVAASLGAALVAMVAELSRRPRYMEHATLHGAAQASGRELADRLLTLADEDAAAYGAYAAALKLPRDTEAEQEARSAATRSAARLASEVPLRCLEACLETVAAAESLAGRCNQNASSDLTVASLLAEAGARGAAVNVLVNLPAVEDEAWANEADARVTELLEGVSRTAATCREVVAAGGRRAPLTRMEVPA
ncbi:MAG TPA: cyclodeaminase/cyclohydrolase family protein [Candidatus Eisenbacteria bacterium]|nr:cyclodeaminase/cyclohydrolase family protein [Candidatus Eisenbacteria bacterium]